MLCQILGRLGLQKQEFGLRGFAKTNFFTEVGFLLISESFFMILDSFETHFHDFWFPGGRLEIG